MTRSSAPPCPARRFRSRLILLALLALLASLLYSPTPRSTQAARPATLAFSPHASTYTLPARFEPNLGQADGAVAYTLKAGGYAASLTQGGIHFVVSDGKAPSEARSDVFGTERESPQRALVSMRFLGSDPNAIIEAEDAQGGYSNYFLGDDPEAWRTGVPGYSKLHYRSLWPGVDLVLFDQSGQLRYDFALAPGADPSQIAIAFDGAERLAVLEGADLSILTPYGEFTHTAPLTYQTRGAQRTEVESQFVIRDDNRVGFSLGGYDPKLPLVIDPLLDFSSFLGGSSSDEGSDIAVESSGSVFVTGLTASIDFPMAGSPFQSGLGGTVDAFVTKITPNGQGLVYSSYFGGTAGNDYGFGIAIDSTGAAYVTGRTSSTDFPTAGSPFQPGFGGNVDAFVTKITPNGQGLVYSSYLGGATGSDFAGDIAVDSSGAAFVTGEAAFSTDFPTAGSPFQPVFGGTIDAFVTKITPNGQSLVYSSYLGGSGGDRGKAIAIDSAGAAHVTGETAFSTDFPTAGSPFQPVFGGTVDAFVTKITPNGQSLVYSSYLGGSATDRALSIAIDFAGVAHVTGWTDSTNFPTAGSPFQPVFGGAIDAFVTKIAPNGQSLVLSSYLGGSAVDRALSIAIDFAGAAYLTGDTWSTDFPTADWPPAGTANGDSDAFVTKIAPNGQSLVYSSYLGGSGSDLGRGIATDSSGAAYVTGETDSANFPMAGSPFQPGYGSNTDGFVAKISDPPFTAAFLAEGSTGPGFETWVLLGNPGPGDSTGHLTFLTEGGPVAGPSVAVPPGQRRSVRVNDYVTTYDVSTVVRSVGEPLGVERAVYSANTSTRGSHVGKAVGQLASEWFLAEGAAFPGFDTWVLVANPSLTDTAAVVMDFFTGTGKVLGPRFSLTPGQRRSFRINDFVTTFDVSTYVATTDGSGVIAERASYMNTSGISFPLSGATDSPGTVEGANEWFLAEGATAGGFETWILVANPHLTDTAQVEIDFLTDAGFVDGTSFALAPGTRRSIRANDFVSSYQVSTRVRSTGPGVIAERALYTAHPVYGTGAATGEGVTQTGADWLLVEGATAGGFETWVLVANPHPTDTAQVQLTFMTSSGSVQGPSFTLGPQSRASVRANDHQTAFDLSTRVTSTGAEVVAERTVYAPAWAGHDSTNGPGLRLG